MKFLRLFIIMSLSSLVGFAQAQVQIQINSDDSSEVSTLKTSYYSYYFGNVWTNSMNRVRYEVTNTGTTPLDFVRATISGPYFDASHTCTGSLQAAQKCWFEITYWPAFEGYHSGRFVLSFAGDENIVVDVWGDARRP